MTRRAVLPVAAWLAALAVAAVLAAGARYTADLSAFLPRSPSAAQQLLVDQLREGAVGRLLLIAIEGGDAAERTALSRSLAQRLRADPRLTYVANGAAEGVERDRQLIVDHRYLLSPAVTPARFTAEGLHEAIADTVDLVASSAGGIAQTLLARDPTGEVAALAAARLAEGPRPAVEGGVWTSRDGQRALMLARTAAPGSDTDAQEAAQHAVREAFAEAAAQEHAPAATLRMAGAGVFAVESRNTIRREVRRVAILGVALVSLLLLAAYRSPLALALGLLPVLTGAAAGLAAVAAGFGVVHSITLGFGTTLIGEAVDYAIYLFVQTRAEHAGDAGPESRAAWLAAFWPTIRLGVLTSMTGFAALLLSGFPGLAQLGLYSVCGLAAAALFTRYVLPTLMPSGLRVRDLDPIGAWLGRVIRAGGRWRGLVPLLALVAAVPLVAQRDGLWARDLSGLSTITDADQAYDGLLRADLGAPDARYVVVAEGRDEQDALRAAERAGAVLHGLLARGVIAGFDSPARYLPSEQTQSARAASLPDPRELRARLAAALRGLPLRAARLEPFVADVARVRAGARLRHADLEGTGIGVAVDSMLLQRAQGWRALLPLRAPAGTRQSAVLDPDELRAALRGTGAQILDLKAEANALYSGYLREAIGLSLAGMAAVLLLLMLALRSARRVGRVVAPLGAAVVVTAAVLWATGQALNLLHLVGFLLVVAVGSNYALFFERAASQGQRGAARPGLARARQRDHGDRLRGARDLDRARAARGRRHGRARHAARARLRRVALGRTRGCGIIAPWRTRSRATPDGARGRCSAASVLLHAAAARQRGRSARAVALGPGRGRGRTTALLTAGGLLAAQPAAGSELDAPAGCGGRGRGSRDHHRRRAGSRGHAARAGTARGTRRRAPASSASASSAARHPELVREIVRRGHAVENHSLQHRYDFALLGPRGYEAEIGAAQHTLARARGQRAAFLPRAGGPAQSLPRPGACAPRPAARELDAARLRYRQRAMPTTSTRASGAASPRGDILLLHDGNAARTPAGRPVVLEVLPRLLDAAEAAGLRTVTLRAALA